MVSGSFFDPFLPLAVDSKINSIGEKVSPKGWRNGPDCPLLPLKTPFLGTPITCGRRDSVAQAHLASGPPPDFPRQQPAGLVLLSLCPRNCRWRRWAARPLTVDPDGALFGDPRFGVPCPGERAQREASDYSLNSVVLGRLTK